jgi:methanethiol S-methyltransferase
VCYEIITEIWFFRLRRKKGSTKAGPVKTFMATPTSAAAAAFSVVSYLYFFAYFCAYWAFLLPPAVLEAYLPAALAAAVPYNMEGSASSADGLLTDLALLAAFALPHSILARTSTKAAHGMPVAWERPFYVFQSTALLHAQMAFWRSFDGPTLWDLSAHAAASSVIHALFAFGFAFLLSSTFALDHFELAGLSQGFGVDLNAKLGLAAAAAKEGGVVARAHYSIVAHPIMTGMMIGCWATPVMSAPRLLFAVANTTYMVVAVKCFEEPQLDATIGPAYGEYLSTVPSFCPMFPKARAAKTAAPKGD